MCLLIGEIVETFLPIVMDILIGKQFCKGKKLSKLLRTCRESGRGRIRLSLFLLASKVWNTGGDTNVFGTLCRVIF